MLFYYEASLQENPVFQALQKKLPNMTFLKIDHYKNMFDRNIPLPTLKSFLFAQVNNAILPAPVGYGHPGKGYFLKNSLNCVYDCSYCYLKGAFKNEMPVLFINYDDMKRQILETIQKERDAGNHDTIWFYSSDYSDNLATDDWSQFTTHFVPFFDTLENVKMEIRTKSTNIKNLLLLGPSQNVEIAFSLNPQEVVEKYEHKTPALDMRIQAIGTLQKAGWQVGARFLPLLEIQNYKEIYPKFLTYVTQKLDMSSLYSIFIGGLLYTKEDYNKILKKEPYLDVLYGLQDEKDGFMREKREVRDYFYTLFDQYITKQKCNRCLDQ